MRNCLGFAQQQRVGNTFCADEINWKMLQGRGQTSIQNAKTRTQFETPNVFLLQAQKVMP
jgi:hypothetical protein